MRNRDQGKADSAGNTTKNFGYGAEEHRCQTDKYEKGEGWVSSFFAMAQIFGRGGIFSLDHSHDGRDAGGNATVKITFLEPGGNLIADDPSGNQVRQFAFQPPAHLDPYLAIILDDDQYGAVINLLWPIFQA